MRETPHAEEASEMTERVSSYGQGHDGGCAARPTKPWDFGAALSDPGVLPDPESCTCGYTDALRAASEQGMRDFPPFGLSALDPLSP